MLSSGYLTIKEKIDRNTYIIKIPNEEIRTFFKDSFIRMVFRGTKYVNQVKKALLSKDLELFETAFQQIVLENISFYNTTLNRKGKNSQEKLDTTLDSDKYISPEIPYQIFMLGFLISIQNKFFVTPEQESGLGRADILLESKVKNGAGYKIKATKKNQKLNKLVSKAKTQIDEKNMKLYLKKRSY